MNKYNLRTTLTSPLGSLVIADPQGIQEAPLSLGRNPTFKSVLETFETPFTYVLRAVDFINEAKALGIDTLITMLVEISSDFGVSWETFSEGVLDLPAISTLSNPSEYKIKLGCRKDDVWTKLLSRVDTDIDVQSIVDLNGNAVAAAALLDVSLPTQVIQRLLRTEMWGAGDPEVFTPTGFAFDLAIGPDFLFVKVVDLPKVIINEIETKNTYPTTVTIDDADFALFSILEATEAATKWEIDFSFVFAINNTGYNVKIPVGDIEMYYVRSDDGTGGGAFASGTVLTGVQYGVDGGVPGGHTVFSHSVVENDIKKGTQIYIRMKYIGVDAGFPTGDLPLTAYLVTNNLYAEKSFFQVRAHTIASDSITKAIRVGEGFDAIIKRITGGDNFYSDFFSIGCGKDFVNMLGLHLRGYNFTAKPFTDNLSERFAAANAIWNIGLGYEKVAGVLKVRIEEAAHFFDSSSNSIDLSYVNNYISTFKTDAINNGVDIGYGKWQLTAGGSLIDDPQTIHTYVPPFKYVGKKLSILCSWIAASLMFELTRRAVEKLSETFDTDNNKFVLAINDDLEAKLDYVAASNLNDPETRYNKELTPGRNFLRQASLLFVGAAQYIGGVFKFTSGLGNFLAEIEIAPDACAGSDVATVTENQDMVITGTVLHGIEVIKFEGFPLNWDQYKLIRDSPNKSIGISKTNADHVPYFIDNIDFFLFERKANFILFRTV